MKKIERHLNSSQKLTRRFVEFLVFIMIVMSSRAILQLIVAGGAVNQTDHLDDTSSDSVLGYLMLSWKLAILWGIFLFLRSRRLRAFHFDPIWLSLIALCFLSILWAEYPAPARVTSLMILFSYILVLLHFEICGWQSVMHFLKKIFLLIIALSMIFVVLLPSYGISIGDHEGMWQGVFVHKNELGLFASVAYPFFLYWYKFEKSLSIKAGIVFSIILIIGCGSTTAYFCLASISAFFLLLHFSLTRKLMFSRRYGLLAIIIGICIYLVYGSIESSNLVAIGDKDTSFSNRNLIWAYLMTQIYESPWLGHGLEQITAAITSDSSAFLENVGFVVGTAHNGFVDALHALGVVGLLFITMIFVRLLRLKQYVPEFDLIFIFLIVFIVQNMFSAYLLGFNFYIIMLMYLSNLSKYMSQEGALHYLAKSKTDAAQLPLRHIVELQPIHSNEPSLAQLSHNISVEK